MRAIQIALLVICLQVGLGLVASTGLFGGMYYESGITGSPDEIPGSSSFLEETEQEQTTITIMNALWNIVTWSWITSLFEPFYSQNPAFGAFIDKIVVFVNAVCYFIVGVAFIEFVRNRINTLG